MKIFSLGGYSEVGKNMTAVQIGEDVVILDAGIYLPPVVELEENERIYVDERKLRSINALPNDLLLDKLNLKKNVKAILLSHAHLDHIGALPYILQNYPMVDVVGTPFTTEVLKELMRDRGGKSDKKDKRGRYGPDESMIKTVLPNSSFKLATKSPMTAEFINITHSTIQTALIALHTKEGTILYANDFKFDNNPIVGKKPNYERLREIAKKGIKVLIVDSLYSGDERKTPSEKIARGLLEDVLLTTENRKSAVIVSTFSSHIARLKSIVDFSKQLNRKPIFIGRSLRRYVSAATRVKMCPFEKSIYLASYKKQVESILRKIMVNPEKYLIVATGHQAEPGSVLDRMSRGELPFVFHKDDHVIFSSKVIPNEVNIGNRNMLEMKLKKKGVRIFNNVHVSGHAGREDLRDMINMLTPENIIPTHGDIEKLKPMGELAIELGYKLEKTVHIMQDSEVLTL